MKQLVFSIYDEKAEAFYPPFFLQTTGMAIREITDCVNDLTHKFGAHPADYTLFQLGEFDNITGEITFQKQSLGCLIEFKSYKTLDQATSADIEDLREAFKLRSIPTNPEVTE